MDKRKKGREGGRKETKERKEERERARERSRVGVGSVGVDPDVKPCGTYDKDYFVSRGERVLNTSSGHFLIPATQRKGEGKACAELYMYFYC